MADPRYLTLRMARREARSNDEPRLVVAALRLYARAVALQPAPSAVDLAAIPGVVAQLERLADELELDIARDDDSRRHPRRQGRLIP